MDSLNDMIVGIVVNPRKQEVVHPLKTLDNWITATSPQAEFLLCTYDSEFIPKTFNNFEITDVETLISRSAVLLTLGGDGTILRTVQLVGDRGIPVLGVNLGGLGFLAETSPENLTAHLSAFFNDQHIIESRSLLECQVLDSGKKYYAFNDLVIDKAGFSRVIEIVAYIDNCLLNSYIADALILSTPTGSTGYSLSAGGPIVIPETPAFILNPICPHSLTNRPVVVPDTSDIRLDVFTEYRIIKLFRDGQMVESYPSGTSFRIRKAGHKIHLIKMKDRGFYDTLRNKLHWGEDFRDKNRWSYKNSVK